MSYETDHIFMSIITPFVIYSRYSENANFFCSSKTIAGQNSIRHYVQLDLEFRNKNYNRQPLISFTFVPCWEHWVLVKVGARHYVECGSTSLLV